MAIAVSAGGTLAVSGTGASCHAAIGNARASIANSGSAVARSQRRATSDAPNVSAGTGSRSVSGRSDRHWRSSNSTRRGISVPRGA